MIQIKTPVEPEEIKNLRAGDRVFISGYIYTGRDAAHKRLCKCIEDGTELPIDVKNQIIYYVGPTPAKPGQAVGSAGPTTSYRMDSYTPPLLDLGLKGMIGKGYRSDDVINSMVKNGAVYFVAIGGVAALISKKIKKSEIICYDDLGAEAIHRFYVEDFPVIVVIDSKGNNLYEMNSKKEIKG